MNEYNSDHTNPEKEREFPNPCTALVPDGEKSLCSRSQDFENSCGPSEPHGENSDSPHPSEAYDTDSSHYHGYSRPAHADVDPSLQPPRPRPPRKKKKRRTFEQRRRIFRRILLSVGAAALALVILSGISVICLIASAPDIDAVTVSPSESATCICDQDGNITRKLTLSSSNREIVSLSEIPKSLQNAVVAIEDERFFEHGGIDLRGIARAFLNGLAKGRFSEGASTITQQLIKNSVFTEWTQENSFLDRLSRKIQEQYLAIRLENQMSKEEILEDYLNIINFGSGCYGAQAASRRYFGKPASELTLSESSVLAAIPQNPTAMNPITFPENNSRRRMTVLNYMEEQGYITAEQHEKALNDNVYDRIREYDADYDDQAVYSYYEDALIDQVISFLTEEKGYTHDQAYRAVYSGGLRIVSAQDPKIQEICDQEFANAQNFPAGTLYGVDYALSIADADGIVTHYGQEHLRSYVRENLDASFNLMCQDPETVQKYVDSFREAMLAACRKADSSEDVPGEKDNSPSGAGKTDDDGKTENGSSDDRSVPNAGDSPEKADSADLSSEDNAGKSSGAPQVLAERLTFSPQPQASVVVMDQTTGFVRAIVGGRGEKTASLTLNRATETTRQPGSTFKILTAYAPALDACGQTLATTYENQPYEYQDGTPVSNWDLNDYSAPVSIREAIARSVNVAAVRCITEITPQLGFQYAQKFGISTLHETYESGGNYSSDIVQPLALGGITQGVTNLELCSAYAAIADGGIYHKPKFFTQITDRHGNIIADYTDSDNKGDNKNNKNKKKNISEDSGNNHNKKSGVPDGTEVIRPSTAWLLTDAMKDVVTSENGTAYGLISAGTMPVAGKTGTTSSYKDIWFAGYTPYYTCCVWGGYDNNDSLPDSSSYHTYNKTLWSSIMTRIHAVLPEKDFERPADVIPVTLCNESGLPAVEKGCTDTRQEFFEKGTEPSGKCTLHKPVPETEKNVIYRDILDELFPERRQTEPLNISDTSNGSKSSDDTKMSETPEISDRSHNAEPSGSSQTLDNSLDTGFSDSSQTPDSSLDSEISDSSQASDSSLDSEISDSSQASDSSFDTGFSDSSQTPDSSLDSEISDSSQASDSSLNSEISDSSQASDSSLDSGNSDSPQVGGQPQTTSLDDMIDQLSRYGLP